MSRSYRMFLAVLLIFLGAGMGLVETCLLMWALASVLGVLDGWREGGPGHMVFFLSFILSPLAGVVGGLFGALLGRWAGLWAPD
jgi:hypothetical protein